MEVQQPYALDLTSLLFTAFTVGFTPLLLVGLLFRWAVHPITVAYNWLVAEPKPAPLLTPWSPSYPVAATPRGTATPRSPYAGAALPLPPTHDGFGSPHSGTSSRRYSPTLRAQSLRSQTTQTGTGTYLNISYSPGLGASLSLGGGGGPNMMGLGLKDKQTRYQPTLRRLPDRPMSYRPGTVHSLMAAQAHASAQPLSLDRSFRQAEEEKWDRMESWRREIMEDDY